MKTLLQRETEGCRKMIRSTDWKYVHDPNGDLDELYDMKNDPWELTNCAYDPAYKEVITKLQSKLKEWVVS
jgi:arylsulfatase A-like enzyme